MKLGPQVALVVLLLLTRVASAGGTFIPAGDMTRERHGHSATLLLDGRVLIAGGEGFPLMPWARSAELYDPTTGTFALTGEMTVARVHHSATLLQSGEVLLVGGWYTATAEIYDPGSGTFRPAGGSLARQGWHMAVPLANGKVLIAGGVDAELYDPRTGRFERAGSYAADSPGGTPILLADGRVLLVGGEPAQLYDPVSDTFSVTGSLGDATDLYGLDLYTATLLEDGRVLIAGGANDEVAPLGRVAAAELYDPATGTFSATSALREPRDAHAAILLADGRVLIVGGETARCRGDYCWWGTQRAAELYDPSSGTFMAAGDTLVPRTGPRLTPLMNGDVLITGGITYCTIDACPGYAGSLASVEIYRPEPRIPER